MSEPRRVPGRAHTDEEKRELIERLLSAWKSPKGRHLRLGQLIVNAGIVEPFYVEDAELIDMVERLTASR
jgi:hypothetical protein